MNHGQDARATWQQPGFCKGLARTVSVELGARRYPIHVGRELDARVTPPGDDFGAMLLVTDEQVGPLHAERWQVWAARGMHAAVTPISIPAGEASKSLEWAGRLYAAAAHARLDRRSAVMAVGGGVVGDLAGFVAATYLRGIRLLQVPTTLLAMVDSSVGGKTAVNIADGKNLVGAFHQPVGVLADLAMLDTLPEREFRSGLAEVVKYGLIRDASFFDYLEHNSDAVLKRDPEAMARVVARCCELKAEVVGGDERDCGDRAILNFGHTLGHAIERVAGYGVWLHGEAVAVGMDFALTLSERLRGLSPEIRARLRALLDHWGLPTGIDATLDRRALREAMALDKKSLGGVPRFVLLDALGRAVPGCEVPEAAMQAV